MKLRTKNIFDYKHVKSVSVQLLIDIKTGERVGKIISNWSDNPAGSVCTSQIILCNAETYGLKRKSSPVEGSSYVNYQLLIGKAGGYGYDKLSSAICSAIHENCTDWPEVNGKAGLGFGGAGIGAVREWFNHIGLELIEIL
jgi:hypothetical protein